MAAADVDIGYLAAHLGTPEDTLISATTNPTADLVNAVLAAVMTKAHDYDGLYSQKLQLEVELETNVRGAEAQRDRSNETAKKALKDVEEMREKLKHEETTRQSLENEIQSVKSSSSTSAAEVETLRARISSLELSNRDTLAIIETKNKANDSLSQELQAQHQKNLKLAQEVATLQQSIQSAQAAATTVKFREQSLQQQLAMAQSSADFYETETKKKQEEALKYRKEKGARLSELQNKVNDLTGELEAKTRTEQQLRKHLEQAQNKTEEVLSTLQREREAFARKEQSYNQDLESRERLVQLKDELLQSQKKRLLEVESRVDMVKKEGEDAVRNAHAQLAQAQQNYDQATSEVETLQAEIARLQESARVAVSPPPPGSAPQTPRPTNGSMFGRPSSPFGTPGSTRKSTTSATQAISENATLRNQLSSVRFENQKLREEIDDMMSQLEAKIPEMDELSSENVRLQKEIQNMSHLSDESFKERDIAKKSAKKAEVALSNAQVEANILRSQLRDLSAQLQMMIFNLEHRDQELTLDETLQLQRIARADGFTNDEMSDVDTLVTERLVVFRDVKDLQEKNQELLNIIHQLSEEMKNDAEASEKQQAIEDRNENVRLKEQIKEFEDRLRTFAARTKSIMSERDMFRRMVEERVSAEEMSSALGRDSNVLASIEQNSVAGEDASDYTTLLRDLQQNFDAYRNEQKTDRETLNRQLSELSTVKNNLQLEIAKTNSQLSLSQERFNMLQSNFESAQSENKELQKRIQAQSESAARQDTRTQQAIEELVETKGQLESTRKEIANLRMEKNMYQEMEKRLTKTNESLNDEKSRLNGLLATHENLRNERDISEAELKRRSQSEIEALQAELSSVRKKLNDEQEENRKLQQRKEYDTQQLQKRIDELSANLSKIREELVATKTMKDNLQVRNDELTIQLNSAAEKAERLQPRPTPRPGTAVAGVDQTGGLDADERIQELIHEAADLKRDLELTKSQLENARIQNDEYRELTEAVEEDLRTITSSQDEYAANMDAQLAAKDGSIKELQQRVEEISAELARSNNELSTLRDSQNEVAQRFQDEKAILDEEIKRLKDQEANYSETARYHQEDLRTQAEIASNAQHAYENEVTKHGETAKSLSTTRDQYNQLKTEVATLRVEAESARATLLQNESSWEDRRKRMEQELSELRNRHEGADAQNKLLHQQLDSVSSQVAALQQNRAAMGESLEAIDAQPSSTSESQLRELASYLRREKDILEVQYDLKLSEAKRLQEQLDYTQSQLDETRLKLDQERHANSDSQRASMSHKDLMNKLEELNVYRESNAVLREQTRKAEEQLSTKSTVIAELESKIQPLEATIEELQSQQTFKEAEIKQLHEDRDRWQKRTEDILAKHGRTDPAEVEELKQSVAALETEKNSLQEAESKLKERVQELEKEVEESETKLKDRLAQQKESFTAQFKQRLNQARQAQTDAVNEKTTIMSERDNLQNQLQDANAQLTSTREELESEKKERLAAAEQIKSFQSQVQSLQEEASRSKDAAPPAANDAPPAVEEGVAASTENASELEKQLAEARSELENVSTQKASIEQELEALRSQLEATISERDQALAQAQAGTADADVNMENGTTPSVPLTDAERQALEKKIAEAEAKAAELEAKARELEENEQARLHQRSEKMKSQLNAKLKEKAAQMDAEREEFKQEKDKLQEQFKLQLEQERKIWEVEQGSAPADTKPPTTPAKAPVPSTPSGTPAIPTNLENEAEVRDFIAKNPTVKSILANNIKSKIAQETKKLKDECEQLHVPKADVDAKITQAREQAQKLMQSKTTLQVNMADNKARAATAKLSVVETAAKETPQRPVVEVWNIAKDAKAPPPAPKPPAPATAAPAASMLPSAPKAPSGKPRSQSGSFPIFINIDTAPEPASNGAPSQIAKPAAAGSSLPKLAPAPVNPFAPANTPNPSTTQPQPSSLPQAPPAQPKSNIPAPGVQTRSGLRQPSGPYQAPRGGAARGGRGGARGGMQGRVSLNAAAGDFQPGNKRPRGESDAAGAGAKRQRGGGPAGQ
ncbi:filament-forming protein [Apiospora rasikravindrae]|uniref:Filament-forming protein n=1 Tax=Apiospora rasikravindrae TaxID=990691 RepID=A0ABR1TFH5_9PEZI